jgi:CDGSH iron-sulfur domain-containing protein 3
MTEENENKSKAVIEIVDFGPLKISGKFILKDTKRNIEKSADEILLCLCGRSNDKPFCDGSHEK